MLVTLQNTFRFKHIFAVYRFVRRMCILTNVSVLHHTVLFFFRCLFSTVVLAKWDYLYLLVRESKNDKWLQMLAYNTCTSDVLLFVVFGVTIFFLPLYRLFAMSLCRALCLRFICSKIESHLNCNINHDLWIWMRNIFFEYFFSLCHHAESGISPIFFLCFIFYVAIIHFILCVKSELSSIRKYSFWTLRKFK